MIKNLDDIWTQESTAESIKLRNRRLYRVRMVLAIGISYLIDTLCLVFFWLTGTIEYSVPIFYFSAGITHVVLFSAIHWLGISERFKDPHLVLWGMLFALSVQLFSILLVPNLSAYFMGVILIIFGFGVLRQPLRQAMILWLITSVVLGLVLFSVSDKKLLLDSPDVYSSAAILFAFATILLRSVLLGYYATLLRLKLFERHLHLGKELEEREQFSNELVKHKAYLEKLVELRTADLTVAMESAEKANRAKSQFLANMSHELRTPLNAIHGFTEILMYDISDKKQRKDLEIVMRSTNELTHMVDRILDLTNLEDNKLRLESKAFTIGPIFERLARIYAQESESKGLAFRYVMDRSIKDIPLIGDPQRLEEIIAELLSNAVKFSDQGEILLECDVKKQSDDDIHVCIKVSDSGIGIADEDKLRILNLFEQADNTSTRRHGGAGIGLSFSNNILKLMGSEFHITSKPGIGSRFEFTIKLNKVTEKLSDLHQYQNQL